MVNSADPDQMPHSVASHLDLHCLLFPICRTLSINGLKVQHVTLVVLIGWIHMRKHYFYKTESLAVGSKLFHLSKMHLRWQTVQTKMVSGSTLFAYFNLQYARLKLKHATLVVLMIRIQQNRHSLFCFMFNR